MNDVAVIDYGMGNLRSVAKALEHVAQKDTRVVVSNDPQQIMNAARVVFPGQGAMRDCMKELQRLGLDAVVRECVKSKPFLGICMGMQVLLDSSEENNGWPGLGIVQGQVLRFADNMTDATGARLKVPHMGWNQVRQARAHALWQGIPDQSRFYFVHSYYAQPSDKNLVAGLTSYPAEFTSVIARDNAFAVQFHPEKSERQGLALLSNFLHWNGTV